MRSLRLPDEVCGLETLADFIMDQPQGLQSHVRVGDVYGAVLSIVVALHQPKGLVCSGQLIPDTALSFPSATAGANPLLN